MIVIEAIIVGLVLLVSQTVANICTGRHNGDQLPNPLDCGSFYVCNYDEPKLFKCVSDLLYDPAKRVCNWAYMVECGQVGSQLPTPNLPNPPYYPSNPYPGEQYPLPQYTTNIPQYPTYTAHPPPMIDVPNHPEFNGADEFYPGLIEPLPNVFHCTNPEFYFAPHPRSCEKYFICENYRIHHHQCGEGIHWDYVFNQCDFPAKTFCYASPVQNVGSTTIGVISGIEPIVPSSTAAPIIEPEETTAAPEETTAAPEETTAAPEETTAAPEETTAAPEETTAAPEETTAAAPEETTAAPEKETADPYIVCPGGQAFIAHPGDCHKYYICIGGIPIVTSCPDKMAWDKDMSQCNEDAWSECFG